MKEVSDGPMIADRSRSSSDEGISRAMSNPSGSGSRRAFSLMAIKAPLLGTYNVTYSNGNAVRTGSYGHRFHDLIQVGTSDWDCRAHFLGNRGLSHS